MKDTHTNLPIFPMSKKKLAFVLVLLLGLFGFTLFQNSSFSGVDPSDRKPLIKGLMFSSMNQWHYNQVPLDDEFSKQAFDLYLERVDPSKRFFLKEDVVRMQPYRERIDDEILKGEENPLFDLSVELLKKRIADVRLINQEILSKPFDFTKNESVELDGEKLDYAANMGELKDRWAKYLKYLAMVRYHNKLKDDERQAADAKEKGKAYTSKDPKAIEQEVRKKVQEDYEDLLNFMEKMDDEDRTSDYLNAMLSVYGPHTEYFAPENKEKFDAEISGRFEGIGARLQQSSGEIKVMELIPGSPSWKQKEMQEGDIILKVAQGEAEPVSVEDMSLKNAVKLIKGPKGTKVRLTIRKPDGRILVTSITRDVVVMEESYSKSAVLTDPNSGKRYGVIYLPSFYADFQQSGGRNSSDDVRAEVVKLKEKGVDGIILDLRNNGGGSLSDVVKMSGLFIPNGPIVQVRSKLARPTMLSDNDRSVLYDGPLVVMVNKFSASASEILAAAMQDYGRAVIVGSNSFGKGTVQRFINLDDLTNGMSGDQNLGSLKLTIQKFYRINGGSTQVKGVAPDIKLPDMYEYLKIGESDLTNVLPWDQIQKADYTPWSKRPNLVELAARSEKRVKANADFRLIDESARRMQKRNEQTLQTLNYEKFKAEQTKLDEESKKLDKAEKFKGNFEVSVLPDHVKSTAPDSIWVESANRWKEKLNSDIYLKEATNVLSDAMAM